MSRDRTYDFLYAAEATRVLHAPTRALETFGTTSVNYHLLAELEDHPGKIRIREGRLQANKPEIITPERYVKDEFEGFGEMAKLYYDFLKQHEDEMKILKYGYRLKQEAFSEQIVTDSMESVAARVIRGVKEGWLPAGTYAPAARKAWLALIPYINKDGDVTNICVGTGKKNDFNYYLDRPKMTGDYHGQGPYLWCAAALLED